MPNGLQSLYLYDGEGRLKELIHKKEDTCLEHLIYGYGNAGEITALSRICLEQEYEYSHTYEYDVLGRITRVKGKEKEKEYCYDAYGNLMEDSNGEHDTVTFNMDSMDRVQTLLKDGIILQQNVYDSMGNRVEMRSKRDEENHRYTPDYASDNRHILMEQGEETNSYLWMGDTLLGIPSENLYVLCDMQGTPLRVVEESGKSINRYRYGIYGEAEKIEEAKHLPFGFAGHVREEHPSYYYASAREYHASKGRFLSRDNLYYFKKADPLGVNLYTYGKGNPLCYADYNGHESIQEYLTLEERLQRDGTDQLWRCIYTIDTDDLKRDILNFDSKSSDCYITLGADIFSYGTGMRFLRYLSPEYIKRTANMVIKGNYCNDFTVLGLAINIAIAITGFDIVQDLRDLSADFTVKFEPKKPEWWLSVGIDFLAVLPVIGLLKYLDETSTGFKSMKRAFVNSKEGIEDSIQYLLKNVPDNLKNIASIQEITKHFNPLKKSVKETMEETGQKSDDLLENIQAIDKKVDIKDVAKEVGEVGKYSELGDMTFQDEKKYSAWSKLREEGLSNELAGKIKAIPKGKKPSPETYLSNEYIKNHLDSFKTNGAVKIMPSEPAGTIGGKGGTFVMSGDELNEIIKNANGDVSKIESILGLAHGYLGSNPVIVKLEDTSSIRIPTGNELGAWPEYWEPGGFTSGGIKEAVIDPVPEGEYTYRHLFE